MGLERHAGRLWASTMGGPLLVLEELRLGAWGGLESGDYDRACAVTEEVETLAVGDGVGLVLGDEPAMTAVGTRSDGLILVRWHAADDAAMVERAIVALEVGEPVEAEDTGVLVAWEGPALIVFDSVEPGVEQGRYALEETREIGEGALQVPIRAGRYRVRIGKLDPRVGSLTVVQLVRE
jgi:hypothetical protein